VPWLAWGLAAARPTSIRAASIVPLAGVVTGAAYIRHLMKAAQ
jgi:hypothetical protein